MPIALADFDLAGFERQLREWGCKPSHARGVLRAFYASSGRLEPAAQQVGAALQSRLAALLPLRRSSVLLRHTGADETLKLLIGFTAGGSAEAVLMPAHRSDRAAGCVSSQIGCAMGCDFCASTRGGLQRNLEAGEIVEQFLHLREAAASLGRRLCSLVFMGMGEPMNNLDNVLGAIRRIADPNLGALGWRQITVSTVGIVPGIDRLADADLNVHLALSLHAPDDATRSRLVPPNRRYPVAEIVAAAQRFQRRTRRIVTIEYCLLDGVNDTEAQAHALVELLAGFRAHVNLIPYNSIGSGVGGVTYRRPPRHRVLQFLAVLRSRGIVAHCRETRGEDVNAACGQLRQMSDPAPVGKVTLPLAGAPR